MAMSSPRKQSARIWEMLPFKQAPAPLSRAPRPAVRADTMCRHGTPVRSGRDIANAATLIQSA